MRNVHECSDEDANTLVHDGERRDRERGDPYRQIVEIKSGPRVETDAAQEAGDGSQVGIHRSDPGHPAEEGQGRKDEAGEEVVAV